MQVVIKIVTLICLLVLMASPGFAAAEIALLHSTPKATVWTDELTRGVRDALGEAAQVSEVFLGSSMEDDEYFENRLIQIQTTWGSSQPAVVIADGTLAFSFMRKYREDLFVGAPVVYCAMERPEPELLQQCGECTGLPLEFGVGRTVDFIFSLRPKTTMVVGIVDGSLQGAALRKAAEQAMEPYLDQAQIIFPGHEPGDDGGLDMEALRDVAASVPRYGAALFLKFEEDRLHQSVDPMEAVLSVSLKSNGPLFVLSDEWMKGSPGRTVGGVVVSARAQGKGVGQAVLRILTGEAVSEMLIEPLFPQATVDLTTLGRFGIEQSLLPVGTVVWNSPEKPVRSGDISATGLVAGVVVISVLGVVFVIIRRKRKSAK